MISFNEKLAGWLSTQMEFLSSDESRDEFIDSSDSDRATFKKALSMIIKLSFIINNNKENTQKLVAYLS